MSLNFFPMFLSRILAAVAKGEKFGKSFKKRAAHSQTFAFSLVFSSRFFFFDDQPPTFT
jgi:hypothetical protein